jgi:hypothetical protein
MNNYSCNKLYVAAAKDIIFFANIWQFKHATILNGHFVAA